MKTIIVDFETNVEQITEAAITEYLKGYRSFVNFRLNNRGWLEYSLSLKPNPQAAFGFRIKNFFQNPEDSREDVFQNIYQYILAFQKSFSFGLHPENEIYQRWIKGDLRLVGFWRQGSALHVCINSIYNSPDFYLFTGPFFFPPRYADKKRRFITLPKEYMTEKKHIQGTVEYIQKMLGKVYKVMDKAVK